MNQDSWDSDAFVRDALRAVLRRTGEARRFEVSFATAWEPAMIETWKNITLWKIHRDQKRPRFFRPALGSFSIAVLHEWALRWTADEGDPYAHLPKAHWHIVSGSLVCFSENGTLKPFDVCQACSEHLLGEFAATAEGRLLKAFPPAARPEGDAHDDHRRCLENRTVDFVDNMAGEFDSDVASLWRSTPAFFFSVLKWAAVTIVISLGIGSIARAPARVARPEAPRAADTTSSMEPLPNLSVSLQPPQTTAVGRAPTDPPPSEPQETHRRHARPHDEPDPVQAPPSPAPSQNGNGTALPSNGPDIALRAEPRPPGGVGGDSGRAIALRPVPPVPDRRDEPVAPMTARTATRGHFGAANRVERAFAASTDESRTCRVGRGDIRVTYRRGIDGALIIWEATGQITDTEAQEALASCRR